MAQIHSSNTKPETKVRKYLFAHGFRYRKNVKNLPGKPDIVLKKYKTIIFVNGCFWHKHECCKMRMPKTNVQYWIAKLNNNKIRDSENITALEKKGWKVIVIWECELNKQHFQDTMDLLEKRIIS